MANEGLVRCAFEQLLQKIKEETWSSEKKLEILYRSRGYLTALQAAHLLYAFGISKDRVKAIEILEPRMCRMTCQEARDVLGAFPIHNDKLRALQVIKRYLCNSQTRDGKENIMSCFPYDNYKRRATAILDTVRSDVFDKMPAGGHQIYHPCGTLVSHKGPFVRNLYGSLYEQSQFNPFVGKVELPIVARPVILPSKYTGHPSYAFQRGRDYAEDRGYPGCGAYGERLYYPAPGNECPAKSSLYAIYPAGAPPMPQHSGAPSSAGFQLKQCTYE